MQPNDDILAIYVPCGSESEAATIASTLLQENLIACANIYASRSLYVWHGKLEDQAEYVMFAKTTRLRAAAAESRIASMHSYETPCILVFPPESVNHSYSNWVRGAVSGGSSVDSEAATS
ncbi:MAG: divalent-cation tolerance protein CutA [Chloroflexota bacterium]